MTLRSLKPAALPPEDVIELHAADGAYACIALHGAQVLAWVPAGGRDNLLYLSERADYAPGQAIRGGVPVIFPQFAKLGPLTKHGFARTRRWTSPGQSRTSDGSAEAALRFEDDPETRAAWPHPFQLELRVTVGAQRLSFELQVRNRGDAPFFCTVALHNYLAVQDVEAAGVEGLADCAWRDSADGGRFRPSRRDGGPMTIRGEVDRIYLDVQTRLLLRHATHVCLGIDTEGFRDAVVWNPGEALAASLGDMADGDWRRFVCIEPARIAQPLLLGAGESWSARQSLSVG